MGPFRAERLLAFARELQHASTFTELLLVAQRETAEAVGYEHVWLFVGDQENPEEVRLIDSAGSLREARLSLFPVLRIKGDAMLEEIVRSDRPVVVEDARTDPRTDKAIVARLGNRTIVNLPLRLVDKPFGAFGMGTYDDEGCRAPTEEELAYLVGMASQLSVAVSRIRYLEERQEAEAERVDLERRVAQMQRLESLGLLAGGIAHDFNNLLTVILTGASLARMLPADKRGDAGIDAIIEAAHRGRDLTRQLLAMNQAQPLEIRAADLNARLRAFLMMARRVIPENIKIDLVQGRDLPPVGADLPQLDQVFLNLCLNARDAMPAGGKLLLVTETALVDNAYVQAHPWAKEGRYVVAKVTDTGIGMTPDVAERVFEPFFTTKRDQGGTGLGLAVSFGIVRRHGGLLRCVSQSGTGTTFEVYLPVLEEAPIEDWTVMEEVVKGGDERLLVAEDDPQVRASMGQVLRSAGYDVTLAENGVVACEHACLHAFDLVILDLVMPQMGGREALPRIRALLPEARFIVATGYPAGGEGADLLTLGDALTLLKPFDSDALLRAVRRALNARPPAKVGTDIVNDG